MDPSKHLSIVNWLEELKTLPEGFLDTNLDSERVDWVAKSLSINYPAELPSPRIYPTEDGNIRLEWLFEPIDISVDINLLSGAATLHLLNLESDEEETKEFDLKNKHNGWNALFQKLHKIFMAQQKIIVGEYETEEPV